MNRWLIGGAVLGCVTAGSVALAGPGSAQSELLEATIEPTTVVLGGTAPGNLTVRSVDPCLDPQGVPGTLNVDIFFEGIEEPWGGRDVDLTVDEHGPEGQWVIEFGAPDVLTGIYTYIVTCLPDDPAGEPIGEYAPLAVEVVAPTVPTAPPPAPAPTRPPAAPAAPAATPIPGDPDFTG
ncbi:MAG: hypothetical protein ACRD2C_05210 [Acidimicrobiales bacterium]